MTLPVGDLERSLAFYRAALVEGMGWNEIDEEGAPGGEPFAGPAKSGEPMLVMAPPGGGSPTQSR